MSTPNAFLSADPELGLDVRPVAGHIGAEIHGVDLRDRLEDATVAAIRASAWSPSRACP